MSNLTVLMTTYNEKKEIFITAIESILNQSLKDFKLLIVIDNPENIELIDLIKSYKDKDNRIDFVINETNLGLPMALNRGIDLIVTKYIARMDADDIAEVTRLEKQLEYASQNPDIDLFGTNVIYMDYNSNILYNRKPIPIDYNKTAKMAKYDNIFNHPTFFGKTEIFKKYKYRDLKYSQDYDFTCRLLEDGCKLSNIPDYLLKYRFPEKKNKDKIIKQKLTYYCIQKCYVKKRLAKTDITQMVENELEKVNKEKFLKAIETFEKGLEENHNKNRFKAIGLFLKSFVMSKYQRKKITNTIIYKLINS